MERKHGCLLLAVAITLMLGIPSIVMHMHDNALRRVLRAPLFRYLSKKSSSSEKSTAEIIVSVKDVTARVQDKEEGSLSDQQSPRGQGHADNRAPKDNNSQPLHDPVLRGSWSELAAATAEQRERSALVLYTSKCSDLARGALNALVSQWLGGKIQSITPNSVAGLTAADVVITFCGNFDLAHSQAFYRAHSQLLRAAQGPLVLGVPDANSCASKDHGCSVSENAPGGRVFSPCAQLPPRDMGAVEALIRSQMPQYELWLTKPTGGAGGGGIKMSNVTEVGVKTYIQSLTKYHGELSSFVNDPLLWTTHNHENVPVTVRVDMRVYGVTTSLRPLRVFLHDDINYRTGAVDVNYSVAVRRSWVSNSATLANKFGPAQSDCHEDAFCSTGSRTKLNRIIRATGLDPAVVWQNLERALMRFFLSCAQMGNHPPMEAGKWNADVLITRHGAIVVNEIHYLGWGLKGPNHYKLGINELTLRPAMAATTLLLADTIVPPSLRTAWAAWKDNHTAVPPWYKRHVAEWALASGLHLRAVWPSRANADYGRRILDPDHPAIQALNVLSQHAPHTLEPRTSPQHLNDYPVDFVAFFESWFQR